MSLKVLIPESGSNESRYTLNVLFEEFLGINIKVETHQEKHFLITNSNKFILLSADFFLLNWHEKNSLPSLPLNRLNIDGIALKIKTLESELPIIYGGDSVRIKKNNIITNVDLFGSCFYLLSRYEEWLCTELDSHGRFSSESSIASKEGFLQRPLVNEYLELLYAMLQHLWPSKKRATRKFSSLVTCDVDSPIDDAFQSIPRFIRRLTAEIFLRKNIRGFILNIKTYLSVRKDGHESDPYWTFDWMMSVCEKYNIKNNFYFIVDGTSEKDASYEMSDPKIINLLKKVHDRGHGIGLHSSYNSYDDVSQNVIEITKLKHCLKKSNIKIAQIFGRQHFLRWKTPESAINLSNAGLDHDSSLGYADHIGFRCGVAYPFKLYDLRARKQLNVVEHPLIVMDCTLFEKRYMGLTPDDGQAVIIEIINTCHFYHGEFVLLWHNSYLIEEWKKSVYSEIIKYLGYLNRVS